MQQEQGNKSMQSQHTSDDEDSYSKDEEIDIEDTDNSIDIH